MTTSSLKLVIFRRNVKVKKYAVLIIGIVGLYSRVTLLSQIRI
jgi:hypothetical protein